MKKILYFVRSNELPAMGIYMELDEWQRSFLKQCGYTEYSDGNEWKQL